MHITKKYKITTLATTVDLSKLWQLYQRLPFYAQYLSTT